MLDRPRSEVALEYWLPTPFASFPFTSPPVRHRVPPGSERALQTTTTALHRVKHHIIKMYMKVEILLHAFLTSALDGNGQFQPLVTLPLGGQPDRHSIEDRVSSRTGRKLWRG